MPGPAGHDRWCERAEPFAEGSGRVDGSPVEEHEDGRVPGRREPQELTEPVHGEVDVAGAGPDAFRLGA